MHNPFLPETTVPDPPTTSAAHPPTAPAALDPPDAQPAVPKPVRPVVPLPPGFDLLREPGNRRVHLAYKHSELFPGHPKPITYGCLLSAWPIARRAAGKARDWSDIVADAHQILRGRAADIATITGELHRRVAQHVADCAAADVAPVPKRSSALVLDAGDWRALVLRMDQHREQAIAKKRLEEISQRIGHRIQLADYPQSFPAAAMARRFIAVLGPTNSGKTHLAFERLRAADSGLYLAPLRLLALEAHQRLNAEFGTPCSLLTGEESREVAGARHLAATVEMLDPSRRVAVAVIDEVQMLGDAERGAAWTQAIVGAAADEVWLLGSPSAEGAIAALAARLGIAVEFRFLKRKQPLVCAAQPLGTDAFDALRRVQPGDCLVVFSRRDALQLRDDLLKRGLAVACVYGALTPEVREAEAERFASGAAKVLVATDAIAMGLNLPIDRVIFTAVQKFDGVGRDDLPVALTQQIAGRAGRYGFTGSGTVAGLTGDEHRVVGKHLRTVAEPISSTCFYVSPTLDHLADISAVCEEPQLAKLLALFTQHVKTDGAFMPLVGSEQLERAHWLDRATALPLADKVALSLAPMSTRDEEIQATWEAWARSLDAGRSVLLDDPEENPRTATLARAEMVSRLLAAYRWCARRFPARFTDLELAEHLVDPWSEAVERLLGSAQRHGGDSPGRQGMPGWYWRYRRTSRDDAAGMAGGGGGARPRTPYAG